MYIFLWYIAIVHTHTHTHCYEWKMEQKSKTQNDFWRVDKAMKDK